MMGKKHPFALVAFAAFMLSMRGLAQNESDRQILDSIGAMNAVKKAHQMTDLTFTPVSDIIANKHTVYHQGKEYTGLLYSSVKEINTYVGQDVSFHTFMTALHNPYSLIYTEKLDIPPYHGTNCTAYYGTVCSGLVSYALGLTMTHRSLDFVESDFMEYVEDQSAKGVHLADVLWQKGHVALITGVDKDEDGRIARIEICQAKHQGCFRSLVGSEEAFDSMFVAGKWKLLRYKHLYKNTEYSPANEFVAVDGEERIPFIYNEDICTNKGDRACFVTGEDVVLNFKKCDSVEIFKDNLLIKTTNDETGVITLKDYPYGNYEARIMRNGKGSDFVKWIIVDVNVSADAKERILFFHSKNSTPTYFEICDISGARLHNGKEKFAHVFSERNRKDGFVNFSEIPITWKEDAYVKVHFSTAFGNVVNTPLIWQN